MEPNEIDIELVLLGNLLRLYQAKFPSKYEEKFVEKAKEMVDEGEISKEKFDKFLDDNDIAKPKLSYDRKRHKLKITEKKPKPDSFYGGCGGSTTRSSSGC